jgi:hypothetical protein
MSVSPWFKVNLFGCYTVERHQYKAKGPLGIKLIAVAKAGFHTTQFWWGDQMGMARGAVWSRARTLVTTP